MQYEIIVVDGGSTDGTRDFLRAQTWIRYIFEERPEGAVKAFNKGFREAAGKYLCWLNDDVVVEDHSLDKMIDFLEDGAQSMVGMGAFYFEDRTWKESKGLAIDYCFGLPFANYGMLRTSLMKKMGYWDESFFRGGGDPDLSLRMWERGMMVVGCQGTRLIHFCVVDEARESTRDILAKDRELFEEKWTERIKPTIMWAESNRDILWRYLDNEGRAEFLFWCGMIQQGRKRFKEAVKHYSEVIDINPSRIDAIYNLASVYRILGQTQKAIQTFQRVLMMSTNDKPRYWAGAYYHLGCLYLERGEHRKAKKYFEDCLSLNPEHNLAKKSIANLVVGLSL